MAANCSGWQVMEQCARCRVTGGVMAQGVEVTMTGINGEALGLSVAVGNHLATHWVSIYRQLG